MKFSRTFAITYIATLISSGAYAATSPVNDAKNAPNGDEVTVSGTVEDYDSRHPFTLRDSSGTVKVDMSTTKPIVLMNGQKVTITGTLDKSLLGTDIMASDVDIDTGATAKIASPIDPVTGQNNVESAVAYTIKTLPDAGVVKITGTVDSVSGAKSFALKDSTGKINVNLKGDEQAQLSQGAEVTVVGYVNNALLGKEISATELKVTAATPVAAE